MTKINIILILFVFLFLMGCNEYEKQMPDKSDESISEPQLEKDLTEIKKDGVLNAITIYSSTSYFLYRGQAMGFEYELLTYLAKELGLELKITIAKDIDELFKMLNKGDGDIVAYGLTITKPRKKIVNFTRHLYVTHQALVQRMPDNWRELPGYKIDRLLVSNALDLGGDTVHVRKNSSYYERLQNLSQEIGSPIHIEFVDGNIPTDEIIKMVVDKKIKYTVADYNIAAINKTYYPILNIDTPVSFSQRIAWAVRKNSPKLLEAVNKWIRKMKKTDDYYVIYNKYFKNRRAFRKRIKSEFFSKNTGKISKYDALIKKYAANIKWDWRLLSSLIYQESKFDPKSNSWAGANGLMQMMAATAKEMGVKDINDPEDNIRGGSKYLRLLWERWKSIPDSVQRIKFVLASYNAGYSHVLDAQALAKKYGKDEKQWDGHVAEFILKLADKKYYSDDDVKYGFVRGREPYQYVKEIFLRYEHYKKFIPL